MTANRDTDRDREKTLDLLNRINQDADVEAASTSWLDHTGGNAQIDYALLWGTSMESMERHRGAVREHLLHLAREHGLKVKERDGIYRLTVQPPDH